MTTRCVIFCMTNKHPKIYSYAEVLISDTTFTVRTSPWNVHLTASFCAKKTATSSFILSLSGTHFGGKKQTKTNKQTNFSYDETSY